MFKSGAGALGFALLLALTGCTAARFVNVTQDGGVVAIPSNTNTWPGYYRNQATELIKGRCPEGFVVEREEEVVTGQTTHTDTERKKTGDPLLAAVGLAPVREKVNTTEYATDQTEWRIWFKRAQTPKSGS